jgi:hypothetical protein
MALIAKFFLAVPDLPRTNTHSTFLGPYYSATSLEALLARLATLVNAVAEAKADDGHARQIIVNVEECADGIYETEKEILFRGN